jgi:hypothetical protein
MKLKIDKFSIECTDFKAYNHSYSVLGQMNVETIFDEFIPFIEKNNQLGNSVNFSIDQSEYTAIPGGFVFDSKGNFQFALITDEFKKKHPIDFDLPVTKKSATNINLIQVTELQDAILRDIINESPQIANLPSVKRYLSIYPHSLKITNEVNDLDEYRKEFDNQRDFMRNFDDDI